MNEWIACIQMFLILIIFHILCLHIKDIYPQIFENNMFSFNFTDSNLSPSPYHPKDKLLSYVQTLPTTPSKSTSSESFSNLLSDTNTKMNSKPQGIIPNNYFEDNYNIVNFPPNVSNTADMYVHHLSGDTLSKIATQKGYKSSNTSFITNKDQLTPHLNSAIQNAPTSYSPATWKYQHDMVMNGGFFGNGITGFDSSSSAFSSFANIPQFKNPTPNDKTIPSDKVDDLRPNMGITRPDWIQSYQ
jgi:hypothetical protein